MAAAALAAWGCASAGDPPGGPPDVTPPQLVRSVPESGTVLTSPPRTAELDFDEVVSERVAGARPDIESAVIFSPATDRVSVGWHRNRLTVNPRGGFRPGRIYRLELLPVITDLRNNRMKLGRIVVFSTGPAIPHAALSGAVVDWVGNRPAPNALIEAVLLPDSLPYRALADSTGSFTIAQIPAGEYLVYGVLDQNANRRRDPREGFDTSRVTVSDTAKVELYAFTHDTVGPRVRSVDLLDSVSVRLNFDRPLDPTRKVDTSLVHVAPLADSSQTLTLLRVFTPAAFDSAKQAEDAARAARDTTQRRRARQPGVPPAAAAPSEPRPAEPAGQAPPPLPPPGAPRRDSTHAMKMLARRPAPSDIRIVRFAAPLAPASRYIITTNGVIGLTGVAGRGRIQLAVPAPRPRPAATDTLRAKPRADSLPAPPKPQ